MRGAIDTPTEGTTIAVGVVETVTGWAVDARAVQGTGITEVRIALDIPPGEGNPALAFPPYGFDRPEIAERQGEPRFRPSGFVFTWDTTGVAPGAHTVYVQVRSACGWADLPGRQIATAEAAATDVPSVTATRGPSAPSLGPAVAAATPAPTIVTPRVAPPAFELAGVWEGTAVLAIPVRLRLQPTSSLAANQVAGQADYPTLGCGGPITFVRTVGVNNERFVFRLRLAYGGLPCVDYGTIILTPTGGELNYQFLTSETDVVPLAAGVLRRVAD